MSKRKRLFLGIVAAELEDLDEDLDSLEESYRHRFEELKLSQYVYLENRALLEREKACVAHLIAFTRSLDPGPFDSVAALAARIVGELGDQVRRFEFPEAIRSLVLRRVKKSERFAEEAEGPEAAR